MLDIEADAKADALSKATANALENVSLPATGSASRGPFLVVCQVRPLDTLDRYVIDGEMVDPDAFVAAYTAG